MLRITVKRGPELTTLKLEGKLTGPWVEELERAWSQEMGEKPASDATVDLAGVTYVDAEGKKLLARMFKQGACLRDGQLMTRYIVAQVMQGVKQSPGYGG